LNQPRIVYLRNAKEVATSKKLNSKAFDYLFFPLSILTMQQLSNIPPPYPMACIHIALIHYLTFTNPRACKLHGFAQALFYYMAAPGEIEFSQGNTTHSPKVARWPLKSPPHKNKKPSTLHLQIPCQILTISN